MGNSGGWHVIPFQLRPFFVSPLLKTKFLNSDGSMKGRPYPDEETYDRVLSLKAYLMVLKKFYEIDSDLDLPLMRVVPDPDTTLDRYYKIIVQTKFVNLSVLHPFASCRIRKGMKLGTIFQTLRY